MKSGKTAFENAAHVLLKIDYRFKVSSTSTKFALFQICGKWSPLLAKSVAPTNSNFEVFKVGKSLCSTPSYTHWGWRECKLESVLILLPLHVGPLPGLGAAAPLTSLNKHHLLYQDIPDPPDTGPVTRSIIGQQLMNVY